MTSHQGNSCPPTSTFIELRPRTRHTISVPPLPLADAVSDFQKTIVTPVPPLPCAQISMLQPQHPMKTTSTITAIRTMQKSLDPSFICTICWSPQRPPATPRVLGRSSRIVCHQCWRAVLDLSICWVCGECIVRGDDVVSLGWCFWHRGCFGCLICGVRLGEGVLSDCVSDGYGRWNSEDGGKGNGSRGIELDKIPLCEWCETETKIKGYGEKKVLERGLENVTRSDGGLTRCRLEKLDEDKGLGASLNMEGKKYVVVGLDGEEMVPHSPASSSPSVLGLSGEKNPIRSSMMNERKIRRIIRNSSTPQEEIALLKDVAKMGASDDGNPNDSTHSHSDTEPADFGQSEPSSSPSPSDIYVSIYDPAGGAFVPSKTKPLPKWMALLPNNVHREREESNLNSPSNFSQRKVGAAISRATLPDSYADGPSSIHSEDCTGEHDLHSPCPTEEGGAGFFTQHPSGNVTPKAIDKYFSLSRINSDKTLDSTRRPSTIQSNSTISSLNISSPNTKAKNTTTRPRSVSIEEKLPRPHQHSASAYRRANRSSTIESSYLAFGSPTIHGNLTIQDPIQVVQPMNNPPRDVSERPLTPYPKNDGPFQAANGSANGKGRVEEFSILTSPLGNFITLRKGSCCGLSTSLESGGIGELRKRDGGVSSFNNTFESFPVPEIGKNNNNYALSMSPKLGVLGMGTEYLERCGMLSGREKGEGRDGGGEKEGIVEIIRRQRVGTVSLGQVAQNVKEEKERKRAETQSQSEWEWMEGGGKDFEDKSQARSRTSLRRSQGVASQTSVNDEKAEIPMSSKRSSRRGRVTSEGNSEDRGNLTRARSNGSRKRKERERLRMDVKGKGKLLEEDDRATIETEVSERGKREELRRELKTLFGEE